MNEVWNQALGTVGVSWQAEAGGSVSLLAETLWSVFDENGDQSLAWRLWEKKILALSVVSSRGQSGLWVRFPGALHDTVRYHVYGPSWKMG